MDFLAAEWDAPPRIFAGCTTRSGGVSRGPYASLNLAVHVGDEPDRVAENRRRLRAFLELPAEPAWLEQVHGTKAVIARSDSSSLRADAAVCREAGVVCAVLTADCLPILLTSRRGDEIAAVHAGWRGLAAGVLSSALEAMQSAPHELLAWIGPAIGQAAFEVGDEVRGRFLATDAGADAYFERNPRGRWQADLPGLARRTLVARGIAVSGGEICTHADPGRFFSYRRDGQCGRTASLIMIRN